MEFIREKENKIGVIIADSNDSFRDCLAELIGQEEGMELLASVDDGEQAFELVKELSPDVLVTELMLRELEGMSLIRKLRESDMLPFTIVVSGFYNDHMAEFLSRLGVAFYFPKPCSFAGILSAIRSCRNADDQFEKNLKNTVYESLLAFGIMPNLCGFNYLEEALKMIVKGKCPVRGVTKILYPDLAKMFKSQPERVERCIRHAINTGWDEGDSAVRQRRFGTGFSGFTKAPTNSAFLALMAEHIKYSVYADDISKY